MYYILQQCDFKLRSVPGRNRGSASEIMILTRSAGGIILPLIGANDDAIEKRINLIRHERQVHSSDMEQRSSTLYI